VLYSILKTYARLAIKIYCIKIIINRPEVLKSKGPLLLASNHPNSFLDGMILTTLFDEKLFSLARGDAFKHHSVDRFLRSIQLLPVYRTSEGIKNLGHNYTTFEVCRQTFEKKGNVLIFSEGRCENEWHLRPLKKGTARLAITSWEKGIPLKVLPTAFNYSSFKKFGKEVHLDFGTPLDKESIVNQESEGKQMLAFNEQLQHQLHKMVYEIDPEDRNTIRRIFKIKIQPSFFFLLLPAITGWILHAPFFYACRIFTWLKFRNSGHYDSVLTSLLLLLYPFWWAFVVVMGFRIEPVYGWLLIPLMPFTTWACVQVKYQADL
jgi:1-acyl-sn-glycerol-3-phosphate acyltransferase